VSATQLTAAIPASDIAVAGTATVTVVTGAPGGGTSNPQTFTVLNPMPTITRLGQSSAPIGSPAFTLTVTGTNFVPSSVCGGTAPTARRRTCRRRRCARRFRKWTCWAGRLE